MLDERVQQLEKVVLLEKTVKLEKTVLDLEIDRLLIGLDWKACSVP